MKKEIMDFIIKWRKENPGLKFPPFSLLMESFDLKYSEIKEIISQLETEGKVKKNVNRYNLTEEKKEPIQKPIETNTIKPVEKKNIKILVFKIIVGIIGLLTIFMGIYYNYYWFRDMLGSFKAIITSIILVTFNVIVFESIFLLKKWVFKIICIILFIIILMFNMFSIFAGQYNSYMSQENTKLSENTNKNYLLFSELEKQEKELTIEIENRVKEREKVSTDSWKYYNFNKEIVNLRKRLDPIREQKKSLLVEGIEKKEDVNIFNFLQSMTHIDSKILKFIVFLLPSLLFDIIASISFFIVLYLKEGEI